MSKNKGIVQTRQLREGDIIDYAAFRGSILPGGSQTLATGLIHHVMYDPQHKDAVLGFFVFEIAPAKAAARSGRPAFALSEDNKERCVIVDPVWLENDGASFARDGEYTQRHGRLDAAQEDALLDFIQRHGGEEKLYFGQQGYKTIRAEQWDSLPLYNKHARSQPRDDFAAQPVEKRARKKRPGKHDDEGKVIDLSFAMAADRLNLDPALLDLFAHPPKGVKALSGLRDVWEMADKRPQLIEQYLPREKTLAAEVPFAALEDELFPAVFNGLQAPRKDAPVKPVTTLQEAFDLVTQRPGDLQHYMYLGERNRAIAIEEITQLYQERGVERVAAHYVPEKIAKAIKNSWAVLVTAYSLHRPGQKASEPFQDDDGNPVWFTRKPTPAP